MHNKSRVMSDEKVRVIFKPDCTHVKYCRDMFGTKMYHYLILVVSCWNESTILVHNVTQYFNAMLVHSMHSVFPKPYLSEQCAVSDAETKHLSTWQKVS